MNAGIEKRLALPGIRVSEQLGRNLSIHLAPGHLLTLRGELGVGKTTLARAIITSRLQVDDCSESIPSPTFSLLQIYETRSLIITHADLYRIDEASELQEIDLEGALDVGALLVEWPRFIEENLSPLARLEALLSFGSAAEQYPDHREVALTGKGAWAEKLLDANAGPLSGLEEFLL